MIFERVGVGASSQLRGEVSRIRLRKSRKQGASTRDVFFSLVKKKKKKKESAVVERRSTGHHRGREKRVLLQWHEEAGMSENCRDAARIKLARTE